MPDPAIPTDAPVTRSELRALESTVLNQISTLSSSVESLAKTVRSDRDTQQERGDKILTKIEEISNKQAGQGKTTTRDMITFLAAGVAMLAFGLSISTVVGSMAMSPIKKDLTNIEDAMLIDNQREQNDAGEFAQLQTAVVTNRGNIDHMDDVLQREMRLLNTATDGKVDLLADALLQFAAESKVTDIEAAYHRGSVDEQIKENSAELTRMWDMYIPEQYKHGRRDEAVEHLKKTNP